MEIEHDRRHHVYIKRFLYVLGFVLAFTSIYISVVTLPSEYLTESLSASPSNNSNPNEVFPNTLIKTSNLWYLIGLIPFVIVIIGMYPRKVSNTPAWDEENIKNIIDNYFKGNPEGKPDGHDRLYILTTIDDKMKNASAEEKEAYRRIKETYSLDFIELKEEIEYFHKHRIRKRSKIYSEQLRTLTRDLTTRELMNQLSREYELVKEKTWGSDDNQLHAIYNIPILEAEISRRENEEGRTQFKSLIDDLKQLAKKNNPVKTWKEKKEGGKKGVASAKAKLEDKRPYLNNPKWQEENEIQNALFMKDIQELKKKEEKIKWRVEQAKKRFRTTRPYLEDLEWNKKNPFLPDT